MKLPLAAGLALAGFKPFAYSIATFATLRCFEQIRNDLCYHHLPVTVVGVGGGYSYGPNGPTHHALEDLAVMRALPHMTVVCPGDPVEAELAVLAAGGHDGPLYLRLGRAGDPAVHRERPPFAIGRAIVLRRGDDAALIATGGMLPVALQVDDLLRAQGYTGSVVSMHTVKPLDEEFLRDYCQHGRPVFTLEEHSRIGGLGAALSQWLTTHALSCRLDCFGAEDGFAHESGSQAYHRWRQGLGAEQIADVILARLKEQVRC